MSDEAAPGVDALMARLDQLEGREAIRTLAYEYCHGFDKRDYDRFLSIWWEDCVWDIGPPFGRFEGHQVLVELFDQLGGFGQEVL